MPSPSDCLTLSDKQRLSFVEVVPGEWAQRVVFIEEGSFFGAEFNGSTDGTVQTLLSFTVPAGVTRKARKIVVTCRHKGLFELKVDAVVIASGRTGASDMNAKFEWNPTRPLAAGAVVVLEYKCDVNNTDVEAYFMASDI